MWWPKLTPREREIMIEMICGKNKSLADVDIALKAEGFRAMNPKSYDIVRNQLCSKIDDDYKNNPLPIGNL